MAQFVALRVIHSSARVRVPLQTTLGQPASPVAAAVATGGTFAAGTYFWTIVGLNSTGNTLPSSEVTATIVLNGSATLTWNAVTGATSYRVYRGTTTGGEDHYQTTANHAFTDTGAAGTAGTPPVSATGVSAAGHAELTAQHDCVVNIDDPATRLALTRHSAIGQWYVSALNASAHSGVAGALTALPSNA